jgi:hypothetical protein
VTDARRDYHSIRAEHRRDVQVLRAILDYHHTAGGERFAQRRIDDDLCRGLRGDAEGG